MTSSGVDTFGEKRIVSHPEVEDPFLSYSDGARSPNRKERREKE